jgi:hypothetical protein
MGMERQIVGRSGAEAGSLPLKNAVHERLAREHAAGASQAEAWRTIGRISNNSSRTFRRPEIQARIEFLRRQFNEMAGVSLAALQARLLRFADANVVADFFESGKNGRLKLRDLPSLPRAVTAPITEMQVDKNGAVRLKLVDKIHAVDSLLKTIGGFEPDAKGGGGTTLEELVRASMEKGDTKVAFQVETGAHRSPDGPPADRRPSAPRATYRL